MCGSPSEPNVFPERPVTQLERERARFKKRREKELEKIRAAARKPRTFNTELAVSGKRAAKLHDDAYLPPRTRE